MAERLKLGANDGENGVTDSHDRRFLTNLVVSFGKLQSDRVIVTQMLICSARP
jgi:hypothetical protein